MNSPHSLRIALAQLNFIVGDIATNADKIIRSALYARDVLAADLIAFPELALSGYPPEDLLLRDDFANQLQTALLKIQQTVQGIDIILGYSAKTESACYNRAAVLRSGEILAQYDKQSLPNSAVFDEKRYFKPGHRSCIVSLKGLAIGILICEDLWSPEPLEQAVAEGAKLIIAINASPFDSHKASKREAILKQRCDEQAVPILYVNTVGGQDELVFDGGSLAVDERGQVCRRADFFHEQVLAIDLPLSLSIKPKHSVSLPSEETLIYNALVLSVKDYVRKNNFQRILLGLSGGIDSALALVIAVDAIGKDQVEAFMLPSRYTALMSIEDAAILAKNLGVAHAEIDIEPLVGVALSSLEPAFCELTPSTAKDVTAENIQARCRGLLLMALANKKNALVLATSNKSEMAVGYATLYGDMVGGFCVLKDVYKTMVNRLAIYRNTLSAVIPERVITRPPSAELAPNQQDTDTLPPYPILDEILQRYIEQDQSSEAIIAAGFDPSLVHKVIAMVYRSEYKRRQSAPGPRVTTRAFGRDRRYPITCGYIGDGT